MGPRLVIIGKAITFTGIGLYIASGICLVCFGERTEHVTEHSMTIIWADDGAVSWLVLPAMAAFGAGAILWTVGQRRMSRRPPDSLS